MIVGELPNPSKDVALGRVGSTVELALESHGSAGPKGMSAGELTLLLLMAALGGLA